MSNRAGGFTLVELLVALAVGGVVLLLAHALLVGVVDAAERGRAATLELTRRANRSAWLGRTFGSTAISFDRGWGFQGLNRMAAGLEADEIRFHAAVRSGTAHAVRRVRIVLDDRRRLVAELLAAGSDSTAPDTLVVAESVVGFGAEYLLDYGAGARWISEFVSTATAPLAARLRIATAERIDTVFVHVGLRG